MDKKDKFGITLSPTTQKSLKFLCERLGLKKSQAIAFALNTVAMNQYGFKPTEKGVSENVARK